MTATTTENATTQREIVTGEGQGPQNPDSPAVSTRARARIAATDGEGNTKTQPSRMEAARAWLAVWWVWINRPPSLAQTWRISKVDQRRIPADTPLFRIIWGLSNWTDRLLMFALVLLAPAGLAGPVRWLTCRPFRRWGFYGCLLGLFITYLIGRK